jgi:hypothetical protein
MLKRMRRYPPGPTADAVIFCAGKTRWKLEQSAQRALAHLRCENPGAFDSTVRPYRCPAKVKRGHWHLGHEQ